MNIEPEIAAAIRYLVAEHGLVTEGSGAVAVAAVLAGHLRLTGGTTAIVVTGRNIALSALCQVLGG